MEKRIVCFGDSNTWGYDAQTDRRFAKDVRWTGVLQRELGNEYTVIEEGLCGRTTVFDDPLMEGLNGLTYLYPCLMSHSNIDYFIVMLGTNDCKERFSATPQNIAEGLKRLIVKAKSTDVWKDKPQILVIAPAPIEPECEQSHVAGTMGVCSKKSYELSQEMEIVARETACHFFDAREVVTMNRIDYMHLDEKSHTRLAVVIKNIIQGESH
ncbi:SGNH/GDSL hydrolase family protein [Lachnospiraceae bacterium LCP25S3_G4]